MRLALYQPDIPQNTGTILRTAACLNVPVDLIGPAGFDTSDAAFRRAGLDYVAAAALTRHLGWDAFLCAHATRAQARLVLLTTKAATRHVDFVFQPGDTLLLGRESAGVPDSVHERADARLTIPMQPGMRSLNVAVAASIVLGEALRQLERWPRATID